MDGRAWSSRCILLPTPLGLPGSRSLLPNLSRRPSVASRDQPSYRVPRRKRIVQGRQWIRVFAGGMAIAHAPRSGPVRKLCRDWHGKSRGRPRSQLPGRACRTSSWSYTEWSFLTADKFGLSFRWLFQNFLSAGCLVSRLLDPLLAGRVIFLQNRSYSAVVLLNAAVSLLTIDYRIWRKVEPSRLGGVVLLPGVMNPLPRAQHERSPGMRRTRTKLIVVSSFSSSKEGPSGCKHEPAKVS